MSGPLIELEHVTKLYGTVIGVNDFTARLEPGAYGLVGPNGAGKSTLLNLLTGQLVPNRGRVRVFGANPNQNSELLSKTGFCPGYEGLYSTTSGLDWVTLLLQLHGPPYRAARARAQEQPGHESRRCHAPIARSVPQKYDQRFVYRYLPNL